MAVPAAQLQRVLPEEDWRVLPLLTDSVTIGRGKGCDVHLEGDRRVSRKHAELTRQGQDWFVRDLGSSNGTLLNGLNIVRSRLRDGDCMSIGETELRFSCSAEESAPRLRWATKSAAETGSDTAPVEASGLTIGRRADNGLALRDARGLSRRHAEIRREGNEWVVRDLGSQNGTFVNGRRVERQQLRDGDEVRFAFETFRFRSRVPGTQPVTDEPKATARRESDPTVRFVSVSPRRTMGDASPAQQGYGFLGLRRPRRRRAAQITGACVVGLVVGAAWSRFVQARLAPGTSQEWHELLLPSLLGGFAAAIMTALPRITQRLTLGPYFRLRIGLSRWAARKRMRRAGRRLWRQLEADPGNVDCLAESVALQLLRGDLPGALEVVEQTQPGDHPGLLNNRGVALARSHALPGAIEAFESGLAGDPGDALCWANLGRALLQSDKPTEAVRALERAVGLAAEEASARSVLGAAYLRVGLLSEAETALLSALDLDSTNGAAANDLGVVYHLSRKAEPSLRFLRAALRAQPGHALARANLGVDQLSRGQSAAAVDELAKARRLSGDSADVASSLSVALYLSGSTGEAEDALTYAMRATSVPFEVPYNLGTLRWLRGDHEAAARDLDRVVKLRPDDVAARVNLGCALLQSGNVVEASEHFVAAVEGDPDNAAAVTNFGLCLVLRGQAEEALPHLERAVHLAPDHVVVRFNLAYCHHLLGNVDEAVRAYERLLESDRRLPEVHANLGLCQVYLGSLGLAITYLRTALSLAPDLHTVPFSIGRLYCETQDLKSARTYLERAQTDEPVNPDVWRNLGLTYYQLGQNELAQRALRRAVQLVPDDAADHNNLAVVYAKGDKHESAIYHFKRALENDPTDASVHGNLGVAYYLSGQADQAMAEWQQVSALQPNLTMDRDGERHVEFDEGSMAFTPLDWRARAVYIPPVGMGLRYRLLPSDVAESWQLAMSDEDLTHASALLRRARRYEDALSALLVSPHHKSSG